MTEPENKDSSEWKDWAMRQAGPGGFPIYWANPETGEIEKYPY